MPGVWIAHRAPGRLRFTMPALRGKPRTALQLEEKIAALDMVTY